MLSVSVCVGSSCHVRNSRRIIDELQEAIRSRNLDALVDLRAEFCLGHCIDGPNVKVGNEILGSVAHEAMDDFVDAHIVPRLEG